MSRRTSLSLTEYARLMGVHRRTAQQWARDGRIRAFRTSGRHWRVLRREIARPRVLTTAEFAANVGVCYRTAVRWAAAGKIAAQRSGPHTAWLIDAREVERFAKAVDNSVEHDYRPTRAVGPMREVTNESSLLFRAPGPDS